MLKSLHAGRVRQLPRCALTCYRCMRTCVLCAAEWSTVTHAVTASAARLLPARAAPSLEQLEAHLQAALLVPDVVRRTAPVISALCTIHSLHAFSAHHIATAAHLGTHRWTRAPRQGCLYSSAASWTSPVAKGLLRLGHA